MQPCKHIWKGNAKTHDAKWHSRGIQQKTSFGDEWKKRKTHILQTSCGQDMHEETPHANPSAPTAKWFVQGNQQETIRRTQMQMPRNENILEKMNRNNVDPVQNHRANASSNKHHVGDKDWKHTHTHTHIGKSSKHGINSDKWTYQTTSEQSFGRQVTTESIRRHGNSHHLGDDWQHMRANPTEMIQPRHSAKQACGMWETNEKNDKTWK